MKKLKRSVTVYMVTLLTAIILLSSLSACSNSNNGNIPNPSAQTSENGSEGGTDISEPALESASSKIEEVLGTGDKNFTFEAVMQDGIVSLYEIHTDADTVGAALLELGLISGEEGPYGLYIVTVNGETLDYNNGGYYWAFYENGEYAAAGVDVTDIKSGSVYSFRASK